MPPTVLVTGCSSGIGRATAEAFLDEGWRVYATTRDPEACEPFGSERATVVRLDVTVDDDVERVVDRVVREAGRVDCLVNNAGFGQFGPIEDLSAEDLTDQLDVNVVGPHRLVRAALPHMRVQGGGTVVNVGSVAGRLPLAGTGAYCGSKAALAATTAALRQEVAGDGVDVVLVEPGLVATEFLDRALGALPEDGDERADAHDDLYRVLDRIGVLGDPLPGVGEPEAVAGTVVEAATADAPDARYRAAPTGAPAALAAGLLPPALRDRAVRAGLAAAASGPGLRLLDVVAGEP